MRFNAKVAKIGSYCRSIALNAFVQHNKAPGTLPGADIG
jgi:hypothetical protein